MINKLKKLSVKSVLVVLVAFLLGLGIVPAIDLGKDIYAEYQFGKDYQTDIRYRVAEEIEAQGKDFFLLGIDEKCSYAAAYIYFDSAMFPEDQSGESFYDYWLSRYIQIFDVLRKYYPDKSYYFVALVVDIEVATSTGRSKIFEVGEMMYFASTDIDAVKQIIADGTYTSAEIMQMLWMLGGFYTSYSPFSLGVFNGELLDRGPDYIYPWE